MSQALARKWRPRSLGELVGQEHVVTAISNALEQQRLHHAYLFTGTRGVGKTTIARIIAKALNCETGISARPCGKCGACTEIDAGRFVDLIELDAASNTQVDNMRELLENALYAPTSGRFKVYIIDEVHMLSRSAFSAMLKTLEEPPEHVKFILATTDPQKVPVTILSRCLQFNLKQIPQPQIVAQFKRILESEQVTCEDGALVLLARAAHGSMRDGLSLLDQAIAHGGGSIAEQAVRTMLGSVEQDYLYEILGALKRADGKAMMAVADRMVERSLSLELALLELATLLHRIALAQTVPGAIAADHPDRATIMGLAVAYSAEEIQLLYQITLHGREDIGLAPDDYAGFTMTLMRMLAFIPEGVGVPEAQRAAAVSAPRTASAPSAPRTASAASAAPKAAPAQDAPDLKKKLNAVEWPALVSRLPLGGMERMLAHNCEFVSWSEGHLQLRVAHAQRHLTDRAYEERLKTALEQHLGSKLKLEISLGASAGNSVAEIKQRADEQRQSAAAASIDSDQFVRDVVENLDARVLPSTIKSVSDERKA